MALLGSRSSFTQEPAEKDFICSECDKFIQKNSLVLLGKKNGKIKKIVCSEECRLEFDDRYWQGRVDIKEGRHEMKKLKAVIVIEYEADPKHYLKAGKNVLSMAAVDQERLEHDPVNFVQGMQEFIRELHVVPAGIIKVVVE